MTDEVAEKVIDVLLQHISLPEKYTLRFIRGDENGDVPLMILLEKNVPKWVMV